MKEPEKVIAALSKELEMDEDAVRSKVEKVSSMERVKTNVDKKTVAVVKGVDKKSVTIPATVKKDGITFKVTEINASAFKNFKKLSSITIGKNIKTIGGKSFYKCSKLKKVTFTGTGAVSIKTKAFKGTNAKMKVQLPKKMKAKQKNSLKNALKKAGISSKAVIK